MDNLGKTLEERQQFKFILFQELNFTKGTCTLKMLQFDLMLNTTQKCLYTSGCYLRKILHSQCTIHSLQFILYTELNRVTQWSYNNTVEVCKNEKQVWNMNDR